MHVLGWPCAPHRDVALDKFCYLASKSAKRSSYSVRILSADPCLPCCQSPPFSALHHFSPQAGCPARARPQPGQWIDAGAAAVVAVLRRAVTRLCLASGRRHDSKVGRLRCYCCYFEPTLIKRDYFRGSRCELACAYALPWKRTPPVVCDGLRATVA